MCHRQGVATRKLCRLEAEGVLPGRTVGKTRVFEFNTRSPTVRNLRELLKAEPALLPESELEAYFRQRQRRRRFGKQMA